jgi:glycosyltransferase involved in cell wall biosynthesis
MSLLLLLAQVIFLIQLLTLADISQGLLRMGQLRHIVPELTVPAPRVSIIVPACNEAETIAPALKTLLDQDYPNLEIIVVNDRSIDATGSVLLGIQQQSARPFTIITIDELPAGWLGKSHALHKGAEVASGDILLFTDADIQMEKTTISRAVTAMESSGVDHLSLIFQTLGGNWLLNAMILDAASGLLAMFKPWKVNDPASRYFIGVGAFNMVRASAYHLCSGHSIIRMHPIDDIMLGKVIKEHGCRQLCLLGYNMVTVRWYATAAEMIEGLMKNVFSVFHYRVWLAVLAVAMICCMNLLPIAGMLLCSGWVQIVFGAAVAIRLGAFGFGAVFSKMPLITIFGGLVSPVLSIYIIGRATYLTLKYNGISWRGSHYSLQELRRSRPLLF